MPMADNGKTHHTMPSGTLLLVDGTGVAYRAFYAIADLATRDGRPTNAVFGFVKMLHQLRQDWKPTHWAVIFDGGTPEARLAALATYKAQRPPMPDPLRSQLGLINKFLELSRVPFLRMDGQEADDVLATLTIRGREAGMDVLIASSDKDLFQLVGEHVRIVPPSKSGDRMGPSEVREKTGVPPDRIAEWLALTGDAVDNVPGVPGVGAKTAAKLLGEFGSLAGIRENLARVSSPKLREALNAHWGDVLRNLEIVTLRTDMEVAVTADDLRVRSPDAGALIPFYEQLEFKALAEAMRKQHREGPMLDLGM